MNIKEAILEAKFPNKEYAYVMRRKFPWYIKVDSYGSSKYWKNGSLHTQNYLTMEDFLAEDWQVMYDRK